MEAILLYENTKEIVPPSQFFNKIKEIKNIDYTQENFITLFFDNQYHLLSAEILFIGGLNFSAVDPRVIFKRALLNNATEIVIAHNHPSSDLEPSIADITFYKRLSAIGNFLGIKVTDCITFNKTEYYSVKGELE